MLFLFLIACTDLLPLLPRKFQSVTKFTVLAFIPITVAMNELASFFGISYREPDFLLPSASGSPYF